ncbi:hypothetical protein [Enterocloster lavalensis]|uniref:hypothetical protein n=1 Tax=Enterocloster lavalensis TaxID=460384 RepID=UPI0026656E5F|nr:hypothetical protein [Enterocloster lavalensis]
MNHSRSYEFIAKNGTVIKLTINAEVENAHKDDVQEILADFAIKSRNFYLSLGEAINNTP